jgi:hypothetical protein
MLDFTIPTVAKHRLLLVILRGNTYNAANELLIIRVQNHHALPQQLDFLEFKGNTVCTTSSHLLTASLS